MIKASIRTLDIVIIEDDFALNTLIDLRLKNEGFNTHIFYDGRAAIKFLKKNQDVFLIMDYQLNDMLSRDIILALKENNVNVPFIVMTGNGDEKVAVEMMKLGAMDYIVKDIGFIDRLTTIISKSLQKIEIEKLLEESRIEIKIKEEKYRQIFENIQDVYFELDFNGLITEISPSVKNVLFYNRNEVIGTKFIRYYAGTDIRKLLSQFKDKQEIKDVEIVILNKHGKVSFTSVSSKVVNTYSKKKIIGVLRDITERKKLEYYLLNSVIETEEKERKRFAEDLHDGLGPLLSSIKLFVNKLQSKKRTVEEKEEYIKYIQEMMNEAIGLTRNVSTFLMPAMLKDYGLVVSIENFVRRISTDGLLNIVFDHDIKSSYEEITEITIYRTITELLNNTLKYANAKNVFIKMFDHMNFLSIKYEDDGVGFDYKKYLKDSNKEGFGLRLIKNRFRSIKAKCDFYSEPNKGFSVNILIDLEYILHLTNNTSQHEKD